MNKRPNKGPFRISLEDCDDQMNDSNEFTSK